MKKFFLVCIYCFIIVGAVYYFWSHPKVTENLILPISAAINSYTQEEIPYNEDFVINDLKLKNGDYYYNILDDNNKAIYKSLANAVKDLETEFYIKDYIFESVDLTMKDVGKTLQKFLLDHPEVFYLNDKYSVSTSQNILGDNVLVKISYSVSSKEELDSKIEEIKNSITKIIENANISEGTMFEKELKLHDTLAKKVKYYEYDNIEQIPDTAHNIYGAFVQNTAVCDGMAKSLQLLLDKIGIESIVLTGALDGESHAWNMIKLDGKWYNLDMTSNKSIKDSDNVVVHSYFNITTEEIKSTHSIDEPNIVPLATSNDYNYFVVLDKIITADDNFDEKLKSILNNNKDIEKIEYKVENVTNVPEKTVKVLRKGKYYDYIDKTMTKFIYYNILDNYIIVKR